MEIRKAKNELPVEILDPKIIKSPYTVKLEEALIGEEIVINPVEDVFQNFPTTVRTKQKLFCKGFIKYNV